MIDYGNARVAALRAGLLSQADLRRIDEAGSAAELLGILERATGWGRRVRDAEPGTSAAAAAEAAIERHRAERLAALPRFYGRGEAPLVEALVLHLDGERIVAILRRRRAGETPEAIVAGLVRGALLPVAALARIARAPGSAEALLLAGRLGVLDRGAARDAAAALRGDPSQAHVEAVVADALDRSRTVRAAGPGADAATVRRLLADERRARLAALAELGDAGAGAASMLERSATAARLGAWARASRRDPLGIGVAAGYVAAVEHETIRVRAALARVVVGWSDQVLAGLVGAPA